MLRRHVLALNLTLAALLTATAGAQDLPEMKFEKYTLDNGLQVILHEDHSIPVVSVNVWYHVGSKNERPGRTGFAHLFEHMMFQGSLHHDADYFLPLQKVGAQVNGSTTEDRTNYWENVPSDQLERALWLEADRMGYLLPAMTQERLDNQKDVVKNEKRQGENQPYAVSREWLLKLLYPDDHPYSWTVIGSMDDLTAASKEDVEEFFRLYYAPNNASLSIAGDFDPADAKRLVEKYFATLPPGRPVQRLETWIPELETERRAVAEDDVELPRLYYAWHSPGQYQPGDAEADLLANILTTGKTSRLYKKLVYELQIAQDVNAYQRSREMSSTFRVTVTARPGVDLAEIERVVDAELMKIHSKGVTEQELELAKTDYETSFFRGLQRVGGFGGRADRLNRYNVLTGDPDYLKQDLQRYRNVTKRSIQEFASRYLPLGRRAVLHVVPQGGLAALEQEVDRTAMPGSRGPVTFDPPAIQTTTLANGLKVYLVEKHELPLVQVNLVIKSGWAADPADKPGTASLTADLLDEGTRKRDALAISTREQELGANLGTFSAFDGSYVNLNILKSKLDEGLELIGDLILNPVFPEEELERIRKEYLGRIQQETAQPVAVALKLFQKRVFGEGHPYAQPYTGSGTVASINALSRDDCVRYHQEYYKPNNAAVVIAGDLTLTEAKEQLQRALGGWERSDVPAGRAREAHMARDARVCVVHRPGAQQSVLVLGHLGLTENHPDMLPLEVMNTALGGQFASRINMNLREDKGYTYGARSQIIGFGETGLFFCMTQVHTEYTKESLVELFKELEDIGGPRPITPEELENSQNRLTMGYPQEFETINGIAGEMVNLVLYDQPLDEWQTYMDRVRSTDRAKIDDVVRRHIKPDEAQIVIIGDWDRIEDGVRELNLGEITVVDADEL